MRLQRMRTFFSGLALLLAKPPASASTIYKYVDSNGVVTYTDKSHQGRRGLSCFAMPWLKPFEKDVYVTDNNILVAKP